MSMITSPPVRVRWRIGDVDYVMLHVTPADLARIKKDHPDMVGIPTYYAIINDDVDWWPLSKEGAPVVDTYDEPPPVHTGYSD